MRNGYPKAAVVWRGAILGGLAHAIMAAENAFYGLSRSWIGMDYLADNQQGQYGAISFEGPLVVATFFDSKSPRRPYHRRKSYDLRRLFRRCPPCHRCLLKTRPNLAPELFEEGVRCATTAFWNVGDLLTAADPWEVVLEEGARLVHTELMEDIEEALGEWQVEMDMKPGQLLLARSLFDRKMAKPTGIIDLTKDEVAFLRSTSEKPSDEMCDEERMTACRHQLAALGVLMPPWGGG